MIVKHVKQEEMKLKKFTMRIKKKFTQNYFSTKRKIMYIETLLTCSTLLFIEGKIKFYDCMKLNQYKNIKIEKMKLYANKPVFSITSNKAIMNRIQFYKGDDILVSEHFFQSGFISNNFSYDQKIFTNKIEPYRFIIEEQFGKVNATHFTEQIVENGDENYIVYKDDIPTAIISDYKKLRRFINQSFFTRGSSLSLFIIIPLFCVAYILDHDF